MQLPRRTLTSILLISLGLFSSFAGARETLVIPGTGDSQALLREIASRFMQRHPEYQVEIPDSIGSGGGVKSLLVGKSVLARTARRLKDKEQNGTLIEHAFALSPVAIAANSENNNVVNITSAQLVKIYTGEITRWDQLGGPAAPIYPVDREAGDSSRSALETQITAFRDAHSYAKVYYSTPETLDAMSQHANTIGYLPLNLAISAGLRVLSIDGITPDTPNIRSGKYPYVTTLYIAAQQDAPKHAKMFIDYLYSDDAVEIIKASGLMPVAPAKTKP